MAIHQITLEAGKQSEPFGIDGRYLYVLEADAAFTLKVANNTEVELQRFEHIDLLNVEQQNRIGRLCETSGVNQNVILMSSDMKILKRTTTDLGGDAIVGLAAGSQVSIDPTGNLVSLPTTQINDLKEVELPASQVQDLKLVELPASQVSDLKFVQLSSAQINSLLTAINDSAENVTIDHGSNTLSQTITRTTSDGTIAAGARMYSIASITGNDFIVNGVTIPGNAEFDMTLLPKGDTYPVINYDPDSAGNELLIIELR